MNFGDKQQKYRKVVQEYLDDIARWHFGRKYNELSETEKDRVWVEFRSLIAP